MAKKHWLRLLLLVAMLTGMAALAVAEPAPSCETCGKEYCYWETPMDITDTEAVWNMLIQPMTVVKGSQREKVILRAEPDETSEPTGEVTCESQGVHVIQTLDNGWSLVECYSSSSVGSSVKIYNSLVKGYLPTDMLEEQKSLTKYGLVADKLTQRMYVFVDGELFSTLRISTGRPTTREPHRETASGEYHLVSMVGSFVSSPDVVCEYAIRFNSGDLIHSTPYELTEEGEKDYWRYERQLGTRASEGCIRVQRRRTPEGVNMKWLWNRLFDQKYSKLVIWEDIPGRHLSVPDAETPVYILRGGSFAYHRSETCYCINQKYWPMTAIPYCDLELEKYAELVDCYYCNPPLKQGVIAQINSGSVEALPIDDEFFIDIDHPTGK